MAMKASNRVLYKFISARLTQIFNKRKDELGMTYPDIADKLDVTWVNVQHYFRGKRMPTLPTFIRLCYALDINPADTLGKIFQREEK